MKQVFVSDQLAEPGSLWVMHFWNIGSGCLVQASAVQANLALPCFYVHAQSSFYWCCTVMV